MPTSAHYTALAYWQETTSGTGPANAAAWVSNATRVGPIRGSVDVSSIGADMVDDERAVDRIYYKQQGQVGIDNPEFPAEFEFESNAATTADTSAIAVTSQMTLMEHCMGGLLLGTSTACAAAGSHTSTAVDMDATTGCDEGTFLAVQIAAYTRAPTALHVRRVTDLTANVATVDQAFPATPADEDEVHAVAQCYVLPSELIDSTANNSTLSWLIQRGPTGGVQNWEVVGAKSQLDSISLGRGEIAKFALQTFGGSHQDPSDAPSPSWTAEPTLTAPFLVGPDCQLWVEDYGTTTNTLLDCSAFNITPGLPVSPDDGVTSNTAGMVARNGYTTRSEPTTIEVNSTFTSSATDFWNDWAVGQLKVVRFATVRPAGQNVAFHFSRCQIRKITAVENGDSLHVSMTLESLEDTYAAAAGNEDLHRSKMTILYY